MKQIILLTNFFLLSFIIHAQDTLVFLYRDTVPCKILKIETDRIIYLYNGMRSSAIKTSIVSYKKESNHFEVVNKFAEELARNHSAMPKISYASKLQTGIYQTNKELTYNFPTIRDQFTFNGKKLILSETGKKIKKNKVWGFCYNDTVYIRGYKKFDRVLVLGKYCYFEEKGVQIRFISASYPPIPIPIPWVYHYRYIVDYNMDEPIRVSVKYMKNLLKNDYPAIYIDFMNEPDKNDALFKYVKILNSKD